MVGSPRHHHRSSPCLHPLPPTAAHQSPKPREKPVEGLNPSILTFPALPAESRPSFSSSWITAMNLHEILASNHFIVILGYLNLKKHNWAFPQTLPLPPPPTESARSSAWYSPHFSPYSWMFLVAYVLATLCFPTSDLLMALPPSEISPLQSLPAENLIHHHCKLDVTISVELLRISPSLDSTDYLRWSCLIGCILFCLWLLFSWCISFNCI